MSSVYGDKIKISLFGQSHSDAIGVVIDGLPHGIKVDFEKLQAFLLRRAARSILSTSRQEPDVPEFLSGIKDGVTCGTPISAIIRNINVRSGDYKGLRNTPRPSHADYAVGQKLGEDADFDGGGHLSGRLTAALCIAGSICIQYLESIGITVGAHIYSIAKIKDTPFDAVNISSGVLKEITEKPFPVINDIIGERMKELILEVKSEGDSVGGIIEFAAVGLTAGTGSPHFGGLENKISAAVFGVPAVKGIEFGNGFACTELRGSENNDAFCIDVDGHVKTKTNNSGGINAGMSNGIPLVGRAAMRPTPSIAREQDTVDLATMSNTKLIINGRHDPCIVHRAVPCIESAVAIALVDTILASN
ncbi:MAG: chorismate synthase [Firmicutes bacterium HGW-Firmicutes-21]|nr:MAG: chorismate synthase [Firmicutes bacterium HGW-Firmicutes-21]